MASKPARPGPAMLPTQPYGGGHVMSRDTVPDGDIVPDRDSVPDRTLLWIGCGGCSGETQALLGVEGQTADLVDLIDVDGLRIL